MVDNSSHISTKERAEYFQSVHLWPLMEDLNYDGWLKNFKGNDELEIATKLLDFFLFYSKNTVNQLLRTSVSNSGYLFLNYFNNWKHEDFKNRCYYSYIPGESPNPSDSGLRFINKVRDEFDIPQSRLLMYEELFTKLVNPKIEPLAVILVDDFIGSGDQLCHAWGSQHELYGVTLDEIVKKGNHCVVYAPLIVNKKSREKIKKYCKHLHISFAHTINDEYNLFKENCYCWENNKELYKRGIKLILKKSRELGIPFSNGRKTIDVRGYKKQGLALSFEHGTPDATLPIFYWKDEGWTPLIKRRYEK